MTNRTAENQAAREMLFCDSWGGETDLVRNEDDLPPFCSRWIRGEIHEFRHQLLMRLPFVQVQELRDGDDEERIALGTNGR